MKPFPVDPNLPNKRESMFEDKTPTLYEYMKSRGQNINYTKLSLETIEKVVADLFIKNERS